MRDFKKLFFKVLFATFVFYAAGCGWAKDELQIFLSSKSSEETTTTFPETVQLDQPDTYVENSLPQFAEGTGVGSEQVTTPSGAALQMGKSWVYQSDDDSPIVGFSSDEILKTIVDPARSLIIVATLDSVEILDTKGTLDPADDVVINKYDASTSVISLCSSGVFDAVTDIAWDYNRGLVYISTEGCGFTVIDTKGNSDASDDILLTRYSAFSPTDWAYSVMYEPVNQLVYLGTEEGLAVINTHGTTDPLDDTLVTEYASDTSPAIPNDWVLHAQIDLSMGLLYVGTNGGLAVINTQGTVSAADDTLVHVYTELTTPALDSNRVSFSFLDYANHILYVGGGDRMVAIDTQGTIDPLDDEELEIYSGIWGAPPPEIMMPMMTPMAVSSIRAAFIDEANHHLYISSTHSTYIVDTKGTKATDDDDLVSSYSTTSSPALTENNSRHVELDRANNLLYIGTGSTGLNVINLNGYNQTSYFESQVFELTDIPKLFYSWIENIVSGSSVTIQTRVATSAIWRNDFDDNATTEHLGDFYSWGSSWGTVIESGGTMKLSNPAPFIDGDTRGVDFWIDTMAIPPSSTVTVRFRINSSTRIAPSGWSDSVYTDDWWDGSDASFTDNTWQTVSFNTSDSYSAARIGFEVVWDGTSWDQINDSVEIDWIQIEDTSTKSWSAWSAACTTSTQCQLDQASLVGKDFLQYRVNMTNTNPLVTPSVSSISFSAGYDSTKNFNSSVVTFDAGTKLKTIAADVTTPTGTSLQFEYSIDGTTWNAVSLPYSFPTDTVATQLQWRVTLSTTDPLVTPSISNVHIISSPTHSYFPEPEPPPPPRLVE